MEKKFLKISIIAMLLVCVCTTITSALSFSVIMTPSKKVVPTSTEFTVEIKVSNLDVGTNGINTLSGNLIYDDDVFETISESSIEGRNGWSHSFNPENNGKITLTKMSFVKKDEEVFQVTFKTKSSEKLENNTKGLIQFKGVTASNSASEITASDVSIEITIGEEDTSNNGDVSVTPNNTANNNGNNNNNNGNNNNNDGNNNNNDGSNNNNNGSNNNNDGSNNNNNGSNNNNNGNNNNNEGNNNNNNGNNNNNNKNNTNTSGGNTIGITPSNTNKNTTNKNTTNTNTNKATNTNTNKNTNKEVSPYVNSTNTTNEDIPYAGAEDYILYFIGAVVAIAIVFYIKFERINKEMK